MAKKPKKEAPPEAEAPEGEAPKAGVKTKLIVIGATLLVLAGGGGGAFLLMRGRSAADQDGAHSAKKAPIAFLDMREMTVNLASEGAQDRPRMLKFKVALELKEAKVLPEIQPLVPRIEDAFQVFVRELRASDLDGSAGMYRLREELLRRVNVAVYPAKVDAVLFKDVVVQ